MIDYKLLEALATIVRTGSFQRAGSALRLTQSAVSQRIKILEDAIGAVVLLRTNPPQLTETGQTLFKHWSQVRELEREALEALKGASDTQQQQISIAVNNDTLYYWFNAIVPELLHKYNVRIEILAADETKTHELVKAGRVHAAISSLAQASNGCKAEHLGSFQYRCVATSEFKRTHLSGKLSGTALSLAPHVVFDREDFMQQEFLEQHFGVDDSRGCHVVVPSTCAFVSLALSGAAWALVPEMEALPLIRKGALIELTKKRFTREIYWHSWYVQPKMHARFSSEVVRLGRLRLAK